MRKWRNAVMACCLGLLFLVMASIFLRFFTAKVLVQRMHMDNGFTRVVTGDLQQYGAKKSHKNVPVNWEKKYPFDHDTSWLSRGLGRMTAIQTRIANGPEKGVMSWTTDNLAGYSYLVECGRKLEDQLGWHIVNPSMNIAKLPDGYLSHVFWRQDMHKHAEQIEHLAELSRAQGASFFYVQTPFKVNAYGDAETRENLDHTAENVEELTNRLQQAGIPILDLRPEWQGLSDTEYHGLFYRTDHHWRPETALHEAGVIAAYMQEQYGMQVEMSRFDPSEYEWQTREDWFLGSQGKKVTLARTQMEDFSWGEPRFPTQIQLEIPSLGIDEMGDFSLMLDYSNVQHRSAYHANPYAMFLYGDQAYTHIINQNLQHFPQKKILAFTDSYGDTMIPFLAMGVREVVKVDVRHFTGSVEKLIQAEKPDIVFLMYHSSVERKLDMETHTGKYDFR